MIKEHEFYYLAQQNINLDEKYDELMDIIVSENFGGDYAASLVFEELFVNIYNYAYKTKGAGPIMVNIEKTDDGILITLADFGIPFNPVERANWMASSKEIGGRGIDLVKSYSKKFQYQRVYGMNVVQVLV